MTDEKGQTVSVGSGDGSAIAVPPYRWVPVKDVLAIIRDPRWSWVRNNGCKYIELRIDTRNEHCLIYDRDKNEITLKDISRQLDGHLSPNAIGNPRCRHCQGRGFIIYSAGGDTRRDECGCVASPNADAELGPEAPARNR